MAITIDTGTQYQQIEGWGAAAVFADGTWMDLPTEAEIRLCYSQADGIGLTHLRHRVPPITGTVESISAAQMVVAQGGSVFGTVFSPPASMKNSGSVVGGNLNVASRADFGNHVCDWIDAMAAAGVNPVGVSLQNEPDAGAVGYESTAYGPTDFAEMAAVVGPIMQTRAPGVWMMGPNVATPENLMEFVDDGMTYGYPYATELLALAGGYVGRLCTNGYGPYALPAPAGWPPVWEVEWSRFLDPADYGMGDALTTVSNLLAAITGGGGAWKGCSLWSYWELLSSLSTNCGIWQYAVRGNRPGKRFWAVGNFSRFVRPGFYRVASTGSAGSANVVAFSGPSGQVVLVAINSFGASQQLDVSGLGALSSMRAWITDANRNLKLAASVPVVAGSLSYTLPASSVVTLEALSSELPELGFTASAGPVVGTSVTLSGSRLAGSIMTGRRVL